MIFTATAIEGVLVVDLEAISDERGHFARVFCEDEFRARGLRHRFHQSSISHNRARGTLRGMHYQQNPHGETKLVRCMRGAVFDVAVDLRPGSSTQGQWVGMQLSADNGRALYIAEGIAHGFQTLEDMSDVLYQITPSFRPGFGCGARWNDPAFGIEWPLSNPILNDRDATYSDWQP